MAYDEAQLRRLGPLVAAAPRRLPAELVSTYRAGLAAALGGAPRPGAVVNVLMHALGHLSDRLKPAERRHFLAMLDDYRARRLPLSAPLGVLGSWAARFEVPYLEGQTFLTPFPPELVPSEGSRKRSRAA